MSAQRNKTLDRRILVAFAGQKVRDGNTTDVEWAKVKKVRKANAKKRKLQRQRVRQSR